MSDILEQAARPGLLRRLAAIFYDAWLIAALWLLGAAADAAIRTALGGAPGQGTHWLLQVYLIAAPVAFYCWFWTHGGQTLGMRAWRLRLVAAEGATVSLRQALIRCAAALLSWLALGLGYLWVLVDPDRAAWHDRLSGTYLVLTTRG
ncbi:MAG: RDD family protein [Gammaproteobacteria bacterium]|nr:MAG: RDD family protein [Gammaproteobacteria bacterium]